MKKLFLLILLSTIVFAQKEPLHTGELIINLTNQGSSWNVTFTLTAISARWDETNNLTNDYETASVNVHSPDPPVAYFDHIWDVIAGINPIFASGLYKISAIENGVEKAYFYMDWRTSTLGWNSSTDVYFKYDFGNKHFKNEANTQIIDHSYQTLWDLTPNLLETAGLQNYWSNVLVVVPSVSQPYSPRIIWGPIPNFSATGYKVYWRYGQSGNFSLLVTVSSSTYVYTHEGLGIGNGIVAEYKVQAYNNSSTSAFSNTVSIGTSGLFKQNFGNENNAHTYQLNQNYPNPFNPTTVISFSVAENSFITLKVYDVLGNEITDLVNEVKEPGNYSVSFNASKLSSGIYFYQIKSGTYSETRKLILQK